MPSPLLLALHGLLVAALTWATVATAASWPGRLPLHLALFVGAGGAWALALWRLPRIARDASLRRELVVIFAVAVALRAPAWLAAPAHSDDVYRYAWDGRVTRAGINPYRYAPADPELAPLRDGAALERPEYEREPARPTARRGPLWTRVNNPDLPTIYPPVAQLFFALAASLPLGPVASLKLLLGLCDLGAILVLWRLLSRRGDDPRWAIAWAWSPLVAVELGQNAHLDALPLLGLVAALGAWQSRRWWWAGVLLGAATAAKLVTAPLFLVFRSARSWVAALVVVVAITLPFATAGLSIGGSTGEFARRWRSNDGVYALLQAASDKIVCRALHAPFVERDGPGPRCTQPLDIWPHFDVARVITGRTYRAAIYPDELSSFCARAVAGLLLGGVLLWTLRRRMDPLDGSEWILGGFLLLTPALHPWYATWILPLVALRRRPAWIALAALIPLGYAPLYRWLDGGAWRDPIWTRALEHGACWALLLLDWIRSARRSKVTAP